LSSYLELIPYIFNYFYKRYGLWKTIKGIFYYHYNAINQLKLPFIKQDLIQINGHPLSIIPGDKGISAQLLLYKTHEPLTTHMLIEELHEGMVCIDIGSNIGYYACLESNLVGKSGKVLAIEPSPQNFEYLKKNLKLQKFQNSEVYNFACGNKDGQTDFFISDRSNWSRIVNDKEQKTIGDNTQTIQVDIQKLDTFVNEQKLKKINLIRMDVEGYETDIYQGMKKTIQEFDPVLHIEIHNIFLGQKTGNFLKELKNDGFDVKYFIPQDMDLPIIGDISDVKEISIDELIEIGEQKELPKIFNVIFEKKIKN